MPKPDQEHGYILVIEQETAMRHWLVTQLSGQGHTVDACDVLSVGLECFRAGNHDVVIADYLSLKAQNSTFLKTLAEEAPDTPVITVCSGDDINNAIGALQNGAVDHLFPQHLNPEVLGLRVQKALERSLLLRQNRQYRQQLEAANTELERSLELLQEDQEAGRRVQFRLLPPSPFEIMDCVVTHRIFPSLYLSGDFVEYFKVGENKLGFYLADVSGHGAASAFVTVFLKAVTNRLQRHYEKKTQVNYVSPSRVLADINAELNAMHMGKHLAMFCGVVDLVNNRLTYSVAAHYPPPLLINDGDVLSLAGKGLPLGLFKEVNYEEHVVSLGERFTLMAASDGVLDVLPKGSASEKEKQLQEIAMHVNSVDDLVSALQLSKDAALPDDVALLVIKRA
ncbi:serine phosphatase RsbU (regulator of sigma subunit) [Fluviicoccus keumensis]|uniref:Serine phosphatase RsbU (Regulator of sigma subunit) n=1 Tax=Fluviicoccus keumensis TaxID=1435465 RepID=A0A4Q7ZB83_9GAMM|nr:SpoIIE family protein phosphatase [Fluviicoccus keumensis]RZU47213.1 serine phosphatase RsbU (regulator of sigma subunit) [Fluviicoccus keumensis]